LVAGIWEYYKPVGYLEGLLTEKIATESIRFSRLLTFERELTNGINMFNWNGLDRLLRYQGTINRQLFQAIRELERMQERRKAEMTPISGPNGMADTSAGTLLVAANSSLSRENPESPKDGAERSEESHLEFSEWHQVPLIIDPRQVKSEHNSQVSRETVNYETNPTGTNLERSPTQASRKAPASPKVSLAEQATKALGLPPMEHQPTANSSANEERESVKKETSSEDILVRPKSIKS